MMKQIMVRAWQLAREGAIKFGGKVREYFAAALSLAWKEIKTVAEMAEEKVIATFEKIGVEIKVIVDKNANVFLEAEGLRSFNVSIKEREDVGAYYELSGISKVAEIIVKKSGKPLKKGQRVSLIDTSAAIAKAEAKKFKDEYETYRFNSMSDNETFSLSYNCSAHSFITNFPRSNRLNTLVSELSILCDQAEKFLGEIGQVIHGWDEPNQYIIKKSDIPALEQFVAQTKAEHAKRLEESKQAEAARKVALIEKAKATGEKQVLRSWTEACNCRNLECDIDHVYELIDGEGNITRERSHTY